jgi:ATP-dependent RNA/DNA helicase IGHMBP2
VLTPEITKLTEATRRSVFFDLVTSVEQKSERSKCNNDEVKLTLALVKYIVSTASAGRGLRALAGKVAVITPYKAQVKALKNAIGPWARQTPNNCQLSDIEINTVDAFQGREKDIVIFNCVRSNALSTLQGSLGFLTDNRRLNVAITRPRHFLYLIGNSRTL